MKIQNLLELIDPEIKTQKSPDRQEHIRSNHKKDFRNPDFLGSGNFSKVMKSDDPHLVKKSSSTPLTGKSGDDGYWTFVDYIIKHKLWENPYFPRIYSRESIEGKENTSHNNVTMEKLEDLENIKDREILALVQKALSDDGMSNFENIKKSNPHKRSIKILAHILSNSMRTGNTTDIGDDELKKAIKILRHIKSENGLVADLKSDNVMGRRTSLGLQLVITDPFAFKI